MRRKGRAAKDHGAWQAALITPAQQPEQTVNIQTHCFVHLTSAVLSKFLHS